MHGGQLGVGAPFSRFLGQKSQHAVIACKQGDETGVGRCGQECLHLSRAFFGEDRARGVEHPAALAEQGPERLEEPLLF